MSEIAKPIAEGEKSVETKKPMSDADFLASRIAKHQAVKQSEHPPTDERKELETVPEAESQKPDAPKEGESEPEAGKPKDVLSKDIDSLTDEEIAELAQRGKSGLLKRLAELVAKKKMAEEKAAGLEAAFMQAKQQLPESKLENNPYATIDSPDKLADKKREVDEVIEWAEDVLFKAENLAADDVAVVVDGREYTKANVRDSLRNARKARDKYLPAQWNELLARQARAQMEASFKMQARKELPWMEGDDNDLRKRFEAMVSDPRVKKMKETVPEIAPQLDYLVAHAANSMFGRRVIESFSDKPKSPTLHPPSNPSSSAATPERGEVRTEAQEKELESRLRQSGKASDFIALRTAQISKRKKR